MSLDSVLQAATVRPAYAAWLDFKDDPVRGWTGIGVLLPTGMGDADLDDETFLPSDGVIAISDFTEDQGIGNELTLTFAVSEDATGFTVGGSEVGGTDLLGNPGGPVYDQAIQDRRALIGRRAKIWLLFRTEDESAILPEYEVKFSGVMVNADMNRQPGQPSTVTLTLDQDTQKANGPPARLVDHQNFNAGDTGSSFIISLSRGPIAGATTGTGPAMPLPGGPGWSPPHYLR